MTPDAPDCGDFSMEKDTSVIKSIFVGQFIIVLHLLLIAAVGLLILFFSGIVAYMAWILIGGLVALAAGGYYLYRRMKTEGKNLGEMVRSPLFRGRAVEVSVLGGLASLKIGRPNEPAELTSKGPVQLQLEDGESMRIRELAEMARLFEKNLVTWEEYEAIKKRIFKS
jgi:hypothetical protein